MIYIYRAGLNSEKNIVLWKKMFTIIFTFNVQKAQITLKCLSNLINISGFF